MRLKIYTVLLVCTIAGIYFTSISDFLDFFRIYVFQWSAFTVVVGLPIALLIVVFSYHVGAIPFTYNGIVNKSALKSDKEIHLRRLLFNYGSFSALSSGVFFALITLIAAISLDGNAIIENGKFYPIHAFTGFFYGIIGSVFCLFTYGAYKRMKVKKETDDGYLSIGEFAAIGALVLITVALAAYAYSQMRVVS